MRVYDKPIIIQKSNELTEEWENLYRVHAYINKAKGDNEYLGGGAIQGKRSLIFEIRYFSDLEDIAYNTQYYRILYRGIPFDIRDFDDFQLEHKTVKLLGVSY